MTHSDARGSWIKEGMLGLSTGVLFGLTSVLVGHPLDSIKTKMQAQSGFESNSMRESFVRVFRSEGLRGLYRGAMPPLLASGFYRSSQFAVYEAVYTKADDTWASQSIPGTSGVQYRVIIGSIAGATMRSVLEVPVELIKVRRQCGKAWRFSELYRGFSATWFRTTGALGTFLVLVDSGRRHYPDVMAQPILGPFIGAGVAATMGWWLVWPIEVLKNSIQADSKIPKDIKNGNLLLHLRYLVETRGISVLARGLVPGTLRSFLSNGASFMVMAWAQRTFTKYGFRD